MRKKKNNSLKYVAVMIALIVFLIAILNSKSDNKLNHTLKESRVEKGTTGDTLQSGDKFKKIFLDVSEKPNWEDYNAIIGFGYRSTVTNSDTKVAMEKTEINGSEYYVFEIPEDLNRSRTDMYFFRSDPNVGINSVWNSVYNLSFDNNYNVFRLTKSNGTASSCGYWSKYIYDGEVSQFAYKEMIFQNSSEEKILDLKVTFSEKNDSDEIISIKEISLGDVEVNKFVKFQIPYEKTSYVKFTASNKDDLGLGYSNFLNEDDTVDANFLYNEENMMCYIYDGTTASWGNIPSKRVYFDASLSKLPYELDFWLHNETIPRSNGNYEGDKVYAHVWDSVRYSTNIKLNKQETQTVNGRTYSDIYYFDVPIAYTNILFYGLEEGKDLNSNIPTSPAKTIDLTIPTNMDNPCFYADSSDPSLIDETNGRGGYWAELYTLRDAEKYKETDVVNIKEANYEEDDKKLYINSTLYDYYTDYELNGLNRDNKNKVSGYYSWVSFRQFNLALSDYYKRSNVNIPLYIGHFQPIASGYDHPFENAQNILHLYGYKEIGVYNATEENQKEFMSVNNSNFDSSKDELQDDLYDAAAQGLINNSIADGNIYTSNKETVLPYFNQDFLNGNNSKNAVLGEIYNNVSFPFTSENINGVKYWKFNSEDTSLEMKYDSSQAKYFLDSASNPDNSLNISLDQDLKKGFFPFNNDIEVTNSNKDMSNYNYGFGVKMELELNVTEDGTITDSNGQKVPIEFSVSGDDDIWVFVDDKLVLDIGGTHGKATGTINFRDMTATVSKTKVNPGSSEATENEAVPFSTNSDTNTHKMTIYYMERGMWESNLEIRFNIPEVNNAVDVNVQKQWDDENQKADSVEVKLYRNVEDKEGNVTQTEQATEYTITLSENNEWKHTFKDISKYKYDENYDVVGYYKYYAQETPVEGYKAEYTNNDGVVDDTIVVKNSVDPNQTKEVKYTVEYYKDGVKVNSDTQVVTNTVQVLEPSILNVDKTQIDIFKKYTNYKCEEITQNNNKISSIPNSVEDGTVIRVYYEKKDAIVIINHIDQTTGEILKTEVNDGKVGDEYIANFQNIDDYIPVDGQTIQKGNMTEETIEINYYYEKVTSGVIEKHIDNITGELMEAPSQYSGNEGDIYTTSEKEFEGYDLVLEKLPNNSTGEIKTNLIEVKYYYVKKATVLIKYIDKNTGDEIDSSDTQNGHEGDSYTTSGKEFDDYVLLKEMLPKNAIGNMGIVNNEDGKLTTEIVVKYYYVHKAGGVNEKHIDITTGNVIDEKLYEGNENDDYSTSSKIIDGYDLVQDKLPDNATGKMTVESIEVKYYYIKKSKVTVEYIDQDTGNKLIDSIVKEGHEGDNYISDIKKIDGYDYVKVEGNAEGKLESSDIIVKHYYKKSENPVLNSISSLENGTSASENKSESNFDLENGNVLNKNPGTGDTVIIIAVIVIIVVIAVNGVIFIVRKNKKKKNK